MSGPVPNTEVEAAVIGRRFNGNDKDLMKYGAPTQTWHCIVVGRARSALSTSASRDGFWLLIAMGQGDARSFMKYPVLIKVIRNPPVNCSLRSRRSERRAEEQSEFRHQCVNRGLADCALLIRPTRFHGGVHLKQSFVLSNDRFQSVKFLWRPIN
jgi:hypothetical protein